MNPFDQDQNDAMVVAVIPRARQLVDRGWCQHTFAVRAIGLVSPIGLLQSELVHPRDPAATHVCLEGALDRAAFEITADESQQDDLFKMAGARLRCLTGLELTVYNDETGRCPSDILELLDRAAGDK